MDVIQLTQSSKRALQALGVSSLYLFGSRAQGKAGPLSDYDFAVLMKVNHDKSAHKRGGDVYDQLYDILSPFCPRTLQNDIIDIVFLDSAPLELRMHVVRYGQPIFDLNPQARLNFEEHTTLQYCDYRPLLNMFDQAILASV